MTRCSMSPDHRENIFQDDFREIGTGTLPGEFKQYNALMVAENFGKTGDSVFLTGVAYDDLNNNHFYTPGEGRGGIKVEATLQGRPSLPCCRIRPAPPADTRSPWLRGPTR